MVFNGTHKNEEDDSDSLEVILVFIVERQSESFRVDDDWTLRPATRTSAGHRRRAHVERRVQLVGKLRLRRHATAAARDTGGAPWLVDLIEQVRVDDAARDHVRDAALVARAPTQEQGSVVRETSECGS